MQTDNYLNIQRLSSQHARTLRALFDAGLASSRVAAWVYATANAPVLQHLQHLGLVSEQGRLTLSGLALAVNLPRTKMGARRWPLAA